MRQLIQQIEQWAEDRNLIKGSTPQKQMLKLMEEFGELCGGIAKNKPEVIKDSIGDCFVVMVIMRRQLGLGSQYSLDELEKRFETPVKFNTELACLDFGVHYGILAKTISMFDRFGIGFYPSNIVFDFIRCYGSLLAICRSLKIDIKDCAQHAYDQIKDRKGKMIDGVFVKEEDLCD